MAQSTQLQETCKAAGQQVQETHEQICQLQNTNRDLLELLDQLEFTYYRVEDRYQDELAQRERYLSDIYQLEADLNSIDKLERGLTFFSSQPCFSSQIAAAVVSDSTSTSEANSEE